MKNKKIIIILIIISIAIFSFAIFATRFGKGRNELTKSEDSPIDYYTCGMHPSVHISLDEYKKGNTTCPICNMNLTPVYRRDIAKESVQGQRKILFYRHPTDPSVTSSIPTIDQNGVEFIPVYESRDEGARYYGCGMKGGEHIFLIKGIKNMACPICGMPLIELSKQEADKLAGIVGRVKIKGDQVRLAGVQAIPVQKQHLFKEIRTVGRVAYDPQLAIAQEEFISALKALDRIQEGKISEIKDRAVNLVESAKRKLKLLGLSDTQIKELEKTRKVHTSLILPEEKMWIYGDIYEYELGWLRVGSRLIVTTASLPGEEFLGIVSSINPVLDPKTRSVRFRAQVDNPGLKLKPEMYVDIVVQSIYMSPDGQREVLAIPKEAVLDTGIRKIVWIDKGNGEYEAREVQIGPEATAIVNNKTVKFYPVLRGINDGDLVVTRANFLIDSQSQITGVAAAAYAGALDVEEGASDMTSMPSGHQH
jgi:multidrug efflux pump subunit AcrA (membrane-fusion protein)